MCQLTWPMCRPGCADTGHRPGPPASAEQEACQLTKELACSTVWMRLLAPPTGPPAGPSDARAGSPGPCAPRSARAGSPGPPGRQPCAPPRSAPGLRARSGLTCLCPLKWTRCSARKPARSPAPRSTVCLVPHGGAAAFPKSLLLWSSLIAYTQTVCRRCPRKSRHKPPTQPGRLPSQQQSGALVVCRAWMVPLAATSAIVAISLPRSLKDDLISSPRPAEALPASSATASASRGSCMPARLPRTADARAAVVLQRTCPNLPQCVQGEECEAAMQRFKYKHACLP